MKINEITVMDLLNSHYEVPSFQRRYEWSGEACENLFEQIYEAFSKTEEMYFLGSVIVHNENNKKEIIDGQQRMTSLLLLIKALTLHHPGLDGLPTKLYRVNPSTNKLSEECKIVSNVLSKPGEKTEKEKLAEILALSDYDKLRKAPSRRSKKNPH